MNNKLPNNNCEDWDRNLLQEIGYFLKNMVWAIKFGVEHNSMDFSVRIIDAGFRDMLHRRNGKNAIYTWR